MKIKHFLQLIIFIFAVLYAPLCSAVAPAPSAARDWAADKGREIIDILTEESGPDKYAKLDSIADNDIELDHAARYVMGKYWKQMTDEQKKTYLPLFRSYTKSLYRGYSLDLKKGDINFEITDVKATKNGTEVSCTVTVRQIEQNVSDDSKGGISVSFLLIGDEGKIKVRDMFIEGRSFLEAYRERFYKMIHEDNEDEIDWFLESLAEITADNEDDQP